MDSENANNIGSNRTTNKGRFVKGDPRCWRKGRPKSFDALRELAIEIAHEVAKSPAGDDIVIGGHRVTIAEAILRQWSSSKNPQLQKGFIEIAFGKTPDKLDVTSGGETIKVIDLTNDERVRRVKALLES